MNTARLEYVRRNLSAKELTLHTFLHKEPSRSMLVECVDEIDRLRAALLELIDECSTHYPELCIPGDDCNLATRLQQLVDP